MREIKFRQPVYVEGKFSYWHIWGYLEKGFVGPHNGNKENYQYTELKDKNGKEIYEGDIYLIPSSRGFKNIETVDDINCFFESKGYRENESDFDYNKIEIIGNVHENPELLEE